MKKSLLTLVLGLNLINITGCMSGISSTNQYGYLSASVRFPQNGFSVKAIPDSTNTIMVEVDGSGLDTPLKFDLTKDNTSHVLNNVPEGSKNVKATALDINGKTVATGENSVNVIAQQLTKVEVELKSTVESPSPTATPVTGGTAIPCIVRIPVSDFPISKSLENSIRNAGCDIAFPDVSSPTPAPVITPTPVLTPTPEVTPTPSPEPTASITTSGSGNHSSDSSSGGNTSASSLNVSLNIHDSSPTPVGISIETPGP